MFEMFTTLAIPSYYCLGQVNFSACAYIYMMTSWCLVCCTKRLLRWLYNQRCWAAGLWSVMCLPPPNAPRPAPPLSGSLSKLACCGLLYLRLLLVAVRLSLRAVRCSGRECNRPPGGLLHKGAARTRGQGAE